MRYAPDMMGSLVYAGGLSVEEALATIGTDGTVLGAELERIGYAGALEPGFLKPHTYVELHIEQGPVLEREGVPIGAVENLQGISWQRVTIEGDANHAGTTPMSMRRDAGYAAARVVTFLRDRARNANAPTVATVGCMSFEPNAINVIPSRAIFTVDLRDPDEGRLQAEEAALADVSERAGGCREGQNLGRAAGTVRAGNLRQKYREAGGGCRPGARAGLEADDIGRGPRRTDDRQDRTLRNDLRAEHRRHQP